MKFTTEQYLEHYKKCFEKVLTVRLDSYHYFYYINNVLFEKDWTQFDIDQRVAFDRASNGDDPCIADNYVLANIENGIDKDNYTYQELHILSIISGWKNLDIKNYPECNVIYFDPVLPQLLYFYKKQLSYTELANMYYEILQPLDFIDGNVKSMLQL